MPSSENAVDRLPMIDRIGCGKLFVRRLPVGMRSEIIFALFFISLLTGCTDYESQMQKARGVNYDAANTIIRGGGRVDLSSILGRKIDQVCVIHFTQDYDELKRRLSEIDNLDGVDIYYPVGDEAINIVAIGGGASQQIVFLLRELTLSGKSSIEKLCYAGSNVLIDAPHEGISQLVSVGKT